MIIKLKILFFEHMSLAILILEIVGAFYKKIAKTNQRKFGIEKLNEEVVNFMSNENVLIIHLIVRLVQEDIFI